MNAHPATIIIDIPVSKEDTPPTYLEDRLEAIDTAISLKLENFDRRVAAYKRSIRRERKSEEPIGGILDRS